MGADSTINNLKFRKTIYNLPLYVTKNCERIVNRYT